MEHRNVVGGDLRHALSPCAAGDYVPGQPPGGQAAGLVGGPVGGALAGPVGGCREQS